MSRKEYLRIERASWEADGRQPLYDIDLQLFEGELAGLISDHAQSADILVRVFKEHLPLIQGTITYRGERLSESREFSKILNRTAVIDSHSQIAEKLTLAENLYIMRKDFKDHLLKSREISRKAELLLEHFQLQPLGRKPLEAFREIERFQAELLKAFATGKELAVLDCRKVNFFPEEIQQLLELARRLAEQGMSFLVLENTPDRLLDAVSQIILIRLRRTAIIWDFTALSRKRCIQDLDRIFPKSSPPRPDFSKSPHTRRILECLHLSGEYFDRLNFKIQEHEMVGIVIQHPQTFHELSGILKGNRQPCEGELRFLGRPFAFKNIEQTVKNGLCFIEHHFENNGLFYHLPVFDNLCIVKGGLVKKLWRNRRYHNSIVEFICQHFGEDISRKQLSELRQEDIYRIMYYKWYLRRPALCINPFFMADLSLLNVIKALLAEFIDNGISVLILTQNEQDLDGLNAKKVIV